MWAYDYSNELKHYGILGMKWGRRRYQNEDGSLTSSGKHRYGRTGGITAGKPRFTQPNANRGMSARPSIPKIAKDERPNEILGKKRESLKKARDDYRNEKKLAKEQKELAKYGRVRSKGEKAAAAFRNTVIAGTAVTAAAASYYVFTGVKVANEIFDSLGG